MTNEAVVACQLLAADGVEATLVDLRWLSPVDDAAIAAVVEASGRVLIVHEANLTGGFGAEVAARIADRHLFQLDAPIRRPAPPDVRFPSAPALQAAVLPDSRAIVAAGLELVRA